MAQAGAMSGDFDRRRAIMLLRHQLNHRPAFNIITITDQRGRFATGDHAHAQGLAIPVDLTLHVAAGNRGMIDSSEHYLGLVASAAASTVFIEVSSPRISSQMP